jgi:hypothetical protein
MRLSILAPKLLLRLHNPELSHTYTTPVAWKALLQQQQSPRLFALTSEATPAPRQRSSMPLQACSQLPILAAPELGLPS